MKIIFTRHAKNRMRWRKITADEVWKTIANPDRKEYLNYNKFYFYKSIGRKYLRITVVVESGNYIIISAVDKND